MLTKEERERLKSANGDSNIFGSTVQSLLDQGRIEDIPDAEREFLSSCETNANAKRNFIRSNWIVGPITNRYILPRLGHRLSKATKSFPVWSMEPANRYTTRILDAMQSGKSLKAEADAIISEIQMLTTPLQLKTKLSIDKEGWVFIHGSSEEEEFDRLAANRMLPAFLAAKEIARQGVTGDREFGIAIAKLHAMINEPMPLMKSRLSRIFKTIDADVANTDLQLDCIDAHAMLPIILAAIRVADFIGTGRKERELQTALHKAIAKFNVEMKNMPIPIRTGSPNISREGLAIEISAALAIEGCNRVAFDYDTIERLFPSEALRSDRFGTSIPAYEKLREWAAESGWDVDYLVESEGQSLRPFQFTPKK